MRTRYELSEPAIDSQIAKLKSSNADVSINISTPKCAAQAIKKIAKVGWMPTDYLANVSLSCALAGREVAIPICYLLMPPSRLSPSGPR